VGGDASVPSRPGHRRLPGAYSQLGRSRRRSEAPWTRSTTSHPGLFVRPPPPTGGGSAGSHPRGSRGSPPPGVLVDPKKGSKKLGKKSKKFPTFGRTHPLTATGGSPTLKRSLVAHQLVACVYVGPQGWTSIRAVVHPVVLPFSLQFPFKKGVDFYLDRFLGGGRGWTSIRARNKQGGWSFIRGGLDRLRFYIHDADTQERRGYGGIHPSEVPRLSSLRPSTGLAAVPSAANLTCAVAPSIPEPRRHLGMPPSLPPPSRWPRRAPAAKLRPSEPSASGAPPSWGAHLETLTHGAGVEVSGPSPAGGGG